MTVEQWLGEDNQLGLDIWNKKYRYQDETFDQWIDRVSGGNADVAELIRQKKFLFGGRILSNRGLAKDGRKITYSNCYVLEKPQDNLESIFETSTKLARTYSYGGGCGVDISELSPAGAKINNAAKETSGAVSFMDLYSLTTELIGQNGRRGALMISMSVHHPDIIEFIKLKTDLNRVTKANISVRVTDDFMEAVEDDKMFRLWFKREETSEVIEKQVRARDIMKLIAQVNWDYGEPGMLFWDTISNYNLLQHNSKFEYAGTNPCFPGDTLIPVHTKKGRVFKKLESLVGKTPEVYCRDSTGNTIIVPADKVWKTRREPQQLIKISFYNGSYIKCTPDHLFYIKDKNWVMAKDLKPNTILFSGDEDRVYQVKALYSVGQRQYVYDIHVPGVHNFYVKPSRSDDASIGVCVSNCGEEPLPAGGSCLLGSINLSEFVNNPFTECAYFDFPSFCDAVETCVVALNEVLDEGLSLHPLAEQRESVARWRQIGLGIMGLADMLIKLGIKYGSAKSIDMCDEIGWHMAYCSMKASAMLAKDSGPFIEYDPNVIQSDYFQKQFEDSPHLAEYVSKHGLRNSQILTIAPTGSISTMLGVSGGIEPVFSYYYERKTESLHGEDKYYKVYAKIVEDFIETNSEYHHDNLPDYFVNAMNLDYHDRVNMQSIWQSHIDASISSTVNVPESFTVEEVEDLYMKAWKSGCKGITLFRNNCKRVGILTPESSKEEKASVEDKRLVESEEVSCNLPRGMVIDASDSNIVGLKRKLTTGCGTLHCVAFFNTISGELVETYLSKGSTGGCNNFMIGLSRMISLAARGGVPIAKIIDQLNSTGVCPSYSARCATKKDTSKGSCCPMAVGNALRDMYREIHSGFVAGPATVTIKEEVKEHSYIESLDIMEDKNETHCPECGTPLVFEGGCNICKNCGWSRCS